MSRNVRIVPDVPSLSSLPAAPAALYDILILPGGAAGAKTFATSSAVLDLVTAFRKEGKWVAAICAGTTALVAAGGAKVRVTSHPGVRGGVGGGKGWG